MSDLTGLECAWETFLPVPSSILADAVPVADPAWLTSRGVEPESPSILLCVRDRVLPLVRKLESHHVLTWYSFLIHDRSSGVPTADDDRGLYIHLRLCVPDLNVNLAAVLPPEWVMTRRTPPSEVIAGIEPAVLDAAQAWRLIGQQSVWLLALLESMPSADGFELVKHVRQFLHLFANMAQMRVA